MSRAVPRRPEPQICAPPVVVVHRHCVCPPLTLLGVNALADMARGPLRLRLIEGRMLYRGTLQAHLRQTVAALLERGLASTDEDREGVFVEITEAGLACIAPQPGGRA